MKTIINCEKILKAINKNNYLVIDQKNAKTERG